MYFVCFDCYKLLAQNTKPAIVRNTFGVEN